MHDCAFNGYASYKKKLNRFADYIDMKTDKVGDLTLM
jgi:hypothetical protein